MVTLHHQIWIDAPVDTVYAAISSAEGIGRWWDAQTERRHGQDLIWEHCPQPSNGQAAIGLRVVERVPGRRVMLECAYAPQDGTAAQDWLGTRLTFDLHKRDDWAAANVGWMAKLPGQTVLEFWHSGWTAKAEYLAFCNTAWGSVLENLKSTCENAD